MYVYIHIYINICVFKFVQTCICQSIFEGGDFSIQPLTHTFGICVCIDICVYIYTCTYICTYMCLRACAYMHIHMYTYIYVQE